MPPSGRWSFLEGLSSLRPDMLPEKRDHRRQPGFPQDDPKAVLTEGAVEVGGASSLWLCAARSAQLGIFFKGSS